MHISRQWNKDKIGLGIVRILDWDDRVLIVVYLWKLELNIEFGNNYGWYFDVKPSILINTVCFLCGGRRHENRVYHDNARAILFMYWLFYKYGLIPEYCRQCLPVNATSAEDFSTDDIPF